MEATVPRVSASFSLRSDILNILKRKARLSHRTLDAYVESVLTDDAYADEPNDATRQAIMEAKTARRDAREVYDNVDALMKDLLEA